ncbi:response regulator transcription factor [Streptomyces sp. NRRL F-5650]|uniref:response regulator transcription factor n=1 Tax=Streptomyces sp. NRRL F-5650 TaxID=1463868 RepID=UPI00131D2FF4|nr:response regulator transcription factor [Streptomyces sp. NRRL F-5650]
MIRVLVAYEAAIVRAGLGALLGESADIDVIDGCDPSDVIDVTARRRPDVVVMGGRAGLRTTLAKLAELQRLPTRPETILLAHDWEGTPLSEALLNGAAGVLSPDADSQTIQDTIRVVAAGNRVLTSAATQSLIDEVGREGVPREIRERARALTRRERDVCTMLAAGLSNVEIGRSLLLSPATIKDHISAIYSKLGTGNRVCTAVLAYRLGLGQTGGGLPYRPRGLPKEALISSSTPDRKRRSRADGETPLGRENTAAGPRGSSGAVLGAGA